MYTIPDARLRSYVETAPKDRIQQASRQVVMAEWSEDASYKDNDVKLIQHFYASEEELSKGIDMKDVELEFGADNAELIAHAIGIQTATNTSTLDVLEESIGVTMMRLRRSNRLLQYAMHAAKDMNARVRAEFDEVYMQLLNRVAEIEHIEKEIKCCAKFRSHDTQLELVTEEQFYDKAPAGVLQTIVAKSSAHKRHIARLKYELQERVEKCAAVRERLVERDGVYGEVNKRKSVLESIKPQLLNVIDSTKPLKRLLGETNEQEDSARVSA